MNKSLLCPMAETCYIHKVYVAYTKDAAFGIIKDATIEGRDFYTCRALNLVIEMLEQGKLSEKVAPRVQGITDCLLIHQANKSVHRRRADF